MCTNLSDYEILVSPINTYHCRGDSNRVDKTTCSVTSDSFLRPRVIRISVRMAPSHLAASSSDPLSWCISFLSEHLPHSKHTTCTCPLTPPRLGHHRIPRGLQRSPPAGSTFILLLILYTVPKMTFTEWKLSLPLFFIRAPLARLYPSCKKLQTPFLIHAPSNSPPHLKLEDL